MPHCTRSTGRVGGDKVARGPCARCRRHVLRLSSRLLRQDIGGQTHAYEREESGGGSGGSRGRCRSARRRRVYHSEAARQRREHEKGAKQCGGDAGTEEDGEGGAEVRVMDGVAHVVAVKHSHGPEAEGD